MFGTEHPKSGTFYNLKPNTSAMDSPLIACSDMFWAVPYQGGGGPVYVSKLNSFGKVEPTCPVVNGHKAPVLDISFSPFHSNIMATASDDSTVKIWQLNEDSGVTSDLTERDACSTLNAHSHSVRTCNFHPTVAGLIFTSSLDLTVKLFDINSGSVVGCLDAGLSEGGIVSNLTFNFDGSLAAIATKDRVVKVLDARTGGVCMSTPTGSTAFGRNLRVEWCCSGPTMGSMATVSTASSGMRQMLMWDPRSMATPICTQSIDNAAGQLFPMYDEGLGVCFLAGKGDTIIRYCPKLLIYEHD
jgi:WD40 repeat protein